MEKVTLLHSYSGRTSGQNSQETRLSASGTLNAETLCNIFEQFVASVYGRRVTCVLQDSADSSSEAEQSFGFACSGSECPTTREPAEPSEPSEQESEETYAP